MSPLFWLDDDSWHAIEPLMPMNRPGVKPSHNRQVISGILHVLKVGCRWCDCWDYGPSTTVYNRFNCWSKAGIWQRMAEQLVTHDAREIQCIDSTTAKAHRCSAGGKGGRMNRQPVEVAGVEPLKSTPSSTMKAGSSPSS
jgi:transposase